MVPAATVSAPRWPSLLMALFLIHPLVPTVSADDFFLTIGGGYNPVGNQASLEANVLFYQQLLAEKHPASALHDIYFADGRDGGADLQILASGTSVPQRPATQILSAVHRRRGMEQVTYRNHQVPHVAGPLDPELIQQSIASIAKAARRGDRMIIYVTAHGSGGPKEDPFDTSIDCWNEKKFTARQFSKWLDQIPHEVPVVMVMAQCYCGGFAHVIFNDLDERKGLAPQVRVGFFAQQHDLPAAGCRPDIEHDQEFSSYFWGAIAGRTRNGQPIDDCDLDASGSISFTEAFSYAVTDEETIDIPLKTSDVFLRVYSRLSEPHGDAPADAATPENSSARQRTLEVENENIRQLRGSLQSYVDGTRPVTARTVRRLAHVLGLRLDQDVSTVVAASDQHQRSGRFQGRGRRRGGSQRRDLLKEIAEKWPELADERQWESSKLLDDANQEQLAAELKQLPGWQAFEERTQQMAAADRTGDQHELRSVKFRRLITTLETIALERRLALVASPEILGRYRELIDVEESSLSAPPMLQSR